MTHTFTGSYTDLYQLTMGQAYFHNNTHNTPVIFDYFFRKLPFEGGFVIFAGLADVLQTLQSFRFTTEDIAFLADRGFDENYLDLLKDFKCKPTIHAPREGDIIFPTEPVLRVEGTMLEVQLIETMILNILNFESLIATKAARIRSVAGDKVLSEFGLRRAHGYASVLASRAAVVGGFDSTSNVYAGKKFDLPCGGTMAHSFIQLYDDELTAFRKFVKANPENSVLLVDTYDTLNSGVPNAIKVAKEMESQGRRLQGVRLDSGDLSFFAQKTRQMLDEEGLEYVKIAASNQLDEYVIRSLQQQNAPIDIFGVGTNLVTGQPDAALDGVYKMVEADHNPRIKLSENKAKTTLPGKKQVYRLLDPNGLFLGTDAITQSDEGVPDKLISPFDANKSKDCKDYRSEQLLHPVMTAGEIKDLVTDVPQIKQYVNNRLAKLPVAYKRFENPHIYKVGISPKIHEVRERLRHEHKK